MDFCTLKARASIGFRYFGLNMQIRLMWIMPLFLFPNLLVGADGTALESPKAEEVPCIDPLQIRDLTPDYLVALVEELVAISDYGSRQKRVLRELNRLDISADLSSRLGITLVVLEALDQSERDDPSILRLFLKASLAVDEKLRLAAVNGALNRGDPPLVENEDLAMPGFKPKAKSTLPSLLDGNNLLDLSQDFQCTGVNTAKKGDGTHQHAGKGADDEAPK